MQSRSTSSPEIKFCYFRRKGGKYHHIKSLYPGPTQIRDGAEYWDVQALCGFLAQGGRYNPWPPELIGPDDHVPAHLWELCQSCEKKWHVLKLKEEGELNA